MASTNAHGALAQCSNVLAAPEGRPQTVITPYRQQGHRGFSLIEVMLVVVVGFIIAGMAIPTFLTIERNLRTSGDARDINGEIILERCGRHRTTPRHGSMPTLPPKRFVSSVGTS